MEEKQIRTNNEMREREKLREREREFGREYISLSLNELQQSKLFI